MHFCHLQDGQSDRSRAEDEHRILCRYPGPRRDIGSDGERLGEGGDSQRQRRRHQQRIGFGHDHVVPEAAVAVYSENLEIGANIRPSDAAGVAMATGDDGVHDHVVSQLE